VRSELLSERIDRYRVNECRGIECDFAHDGKRGIQNGQTGNLREKKTHRQLTNEPHGSSQGPGGKAGWTLAKRCNMARVNSQ